MSRAITKEEAIDTLLKQIAATAHYWGTVSPITGAKGLTPLERCNGVAFSILSILDGNGLNVPAMDLVPKTRTAEDGSIHAYIGVMPSPHPEDRDYRISEGENYWPTGQVINDETSLHESWHRYERARISA